MSSALEHEDLENVALVRMEDVQPSRDRIVRIDRSVDLHIPATGEKIFEYCIDDKVEYENECEIDDDSDSNIGSMVSIQSEEVVGEEEEVVGEEEEVIGEEEEDSEAGHLIVPDVLDVPTEENLPMKAIKLKTAVKPTQSVSWPTLEILPGGVIKNMVDCETLPARSESVPPGKGEMMYACAKCSQVFKYLYCLVKHVKWHENQNKLMKAPHLRKMTPLEEEFILIKEERNDLDQKYKMQKIEVLARIAAAVGKINDTKDFLNK